tara:strand:- start:585 stop:815 length:231 start_codon:yes stop_codon:yes gene_type:complete
LNNQFPQDYHQELPPHLREFLGHLRSTPDFSSLLDHIAVTDVPRWTPDASEKKWIFDSGRRSGEQFIIDLLRGNHG